jgi:hypothetical protein
MIRRFYPASILATFALLVITAHFALTLVPIPPALLRPPVQSVALMDRNGIPLRETRVAERFNHNLALPIPGSTGSRPDGRCSRAWLMATSFPARRPLRSSS